MSFIVYDLTFLVLFSLAVALFLYIKRRNLKREGVLYLYKTSIGLKFIDHIGKKYPKTLKFLSYVSVILGYLLMIFSIYFLFQLVWLFTKPEIVQAVKIPPIMPLIPYLPGLFNATWLPPFYFTYWIVAIAIVAIAHEGFHGIFARFYKIKIKSTGFGFLGPFLAFFVEQDEKQMKKAKIFPQLSIVSAGVFANTILTFVFLFIMIGFMHFAYSPSGIIFDDYSYSALPITILGSSTLINETLKIDGITLKGIIFENKTYFVSENAFNETLIKETKEKTQGEIYLKFYHDEPAINNGLRGAITEINGKQITSQKDFQLALLGKKPGDDIILTTEYEENGSLKQLDYNINLGNDYGNNSRAVVGIATLSSGKTKGFKGFIVRIIEIFQDSHTYYKAKVNPELTFFIKTLFWWLFMINFSVALANMIPLGIFDGGRFFYLTILAITRKEKIADKAFKIITWLLLALIALSMFFYFINIF